MATPFQALLSSQMDQRGWIAADLVRASRDRLTKQTLSLWLKRPLKSMPREPNIQAVAEAFSIHPDVVRRAAAASIGVPVAQIPLPSALDLADIPGDVLVLELARRIGASAAAAHRAGSLAAYHPSGRH